MSPRPGDIVLAPRGILHDRFRERMPYGPFLVVSVGLNQTKKRYADGRCACTAVWMLALDSRARLVPITVQR